jgi:sterol desaturase/sphingolipid hydroxylase (fatty acid hydroxylase superfamily)
MIREALLSPLAITCGAMIFIVLERKFPYEQGQPLFRKGFWNDLVMYTIIQSYILSYVIAFLTAGIDKIAGLGRYGLLADVPIWAVVTGSLFIHDFYIYWFHRWQHHNTYLWRIHEAHHSTEAVDWLSGSRSHSLEILINQTVEFAPFVLLGAQPGAIVVKATIDALWGMYIHSNIDVHSGRLQHFINGPEMHRWHHAREISDGGLNFSTKFAIWDWIFGTAYQPKEKPAAYGIDDENYPGGYIAQHLYAFRPRR